MQTQSRSTKNVAAQLYLSTRTVASHLRQVFTKLGISSRAEIRDVNLTGLSTAAPPEP